MTSLAIFLLIIAVAESVAPLPTMFYDCEEYPGDQYEQIDQTRRECIRENVDGTDLVFCKPWQCATPQCPEEDQTVWDDGCKACPGMCASGGKFYPLDSSSTCVVSTPLVGYNRFALCNAS